MDHNPPVPKDRWVGKGLWIRDLRMQDLSEMDVDGGLAGRTEYDNMLLMNQRKGMRGARHLFCWS
jgi:hypothetical protein